METKEQKPKNKGNAKQDTTQGANIRKLVSLAKQQRVFKEKQLERTGRTLVFELTDKSRSRSPQSVYALNPVHTIYIPHDQPYIEFKGSSEQVEITGEVTLRYVPGERSLFAHLQKETDIKTQLISFYGGYKSVNEKQNPKLFQFLSICPKNAESPYRNPSIKPAYRVMNSDAVVEEKHTQAIKSFEVVRAVIELSDDEILSYACVAGLDITQDPKILRIVLKEQAEKDPQAIHSLLNDPHQTTKETYIVAKDFGIIRNDSGVIKWENGNTIAIIPQGIDEMDFIVDFFREEQGVVVLEKIRQRIEEM